MTIKYRLFLVTLIASISIVGLLLLRQPSQSFAQQNFPPSTRYPACGCYVCGLLLSVNFPNKAQNCAGILATDACPVELAKMTVGTRKAFCKQLRERSNNASLDECLILKGACESEDAPTEGGSNCENPTPWTDRSRPCSDVQTPKTEVKQSVISVSICGATVFRFKSDTTDRTFLDAQRAAINDLVLERVGNKVCCDRFRDRDATCDPRTDFDCDGKNNQTDVIAGRGGTYPDFNMGYTRTAGAPIDPFPAGLDPNAPDFRPENTGRNSKGVGECPCKWELIKGDMNCARDPTQQHTYTATWRCPSTRAEVFTTKYFSGSTPCSSKSAKAARSMGFELNAFWALAINSSKSG